MLQHLLSMQTILWQHLLACLQYMNPAHLHCRSITSCEPTSILSFHASGLGRQLTKKVSCELNNTLFQLQLDYTDSNMHIHPSVTDVCCAQSCFCYLILLRLWAASTFYHHHHQHHHYPFNRRWRAAPPLHWQCTPHDGAAARGAGVSAGGGGTEPCT